MLMSGSSVDLVYDLGQYRSESREGGQVVTFEIGDGVSTLHEDGTSDAAGAATTRTRRTLGRPRPGK
jgi:hypothetical protein